MKLAILSFNGRSQMLYQKIKDWMEYEIVCGVETEFQKWGKQEMAPGEYLTYFSAGKAAKKYKAHEIDGFIVPSLDPGTNDVYEDLMEFFHISEEDFWYAQNLLFCEETLSQEEAKREICRYRDHREIDNLEIHVADHCNLQCKNCTMMAGLVDHPVFPDFEETIEGIRKARSFFDHTKIFRVLGGEPLLNPELGRYLDTIREIFPYTDLRLATNGLLLSAASEELLECMVRNRVTLYISYYCLPADHMEEIHELLDQRGISHSITKPVTSFQKVYNLKGDTDKEFSFESCIWRKHGCETLKGHELSVCFVPTVIHYLREHFRIDIPDDGRLDLFQEGLTTKRVREFLKQPFETCRFCALRGHFEKWEYLNEDTKEKLSSWSI